MKQITLTIILLTASLFSLQAQESVDRQRKWLIGVSLTPIFQGIPPVASQNSIGTQIKYFAGSSGKHAIRLYTSYTNQSSEKDTSYIDNATGFVLAPGYQYTIEEDKFKIFFGADLYIATLTTINKSGAAAPYNKTEIGHTGFKIFMGVSYQLNKRLSISAELGKLMAGETKKVYLSSKGTPTEFKGSYDNFVGSQILMLNYHF